MKLIIPAGLIVLVGVVTVFSAGCVNDPDLYAIDNFSVMVPHTWSTDSLDYHRGWSDGDLRYREAYKAAEGWKFIILDMRIYNEANETRIFRYPRILDEAYVEYFPVILEGDAHFCYYEYDDYLSKYIEYWKPELLFSGNTNRYISIVYKMPMNERPAKLYYQIFDSDGIYFGSAYEDL